MEHPTAHAPAHPFPEKFLPDAITFDDVLLVPSQAVLDKRVDSLPQKLRDTSELIDKDKTFARVVFLYKDGKAVMTPVTASSLALPGENRTSQPSIHNCCGGALA